jgi:hypothetical protein
MYEETEAPAQFGGLAAVYQALHKTKEADAALKRFATEYAEDFPMGMAQIYALRGKKDEAFKWLDPTCRRMSIFG